MNTLLFAASLLFLVGLGSGPAHAETPLSSRLSAGVAMGGGSHQGFRVDGLSYLAAADLLWRAGPQQSYLLSAEAAGVDVGPGAYSASSSWSRLDSMRHLAFLLGVERSRARPGFGPYLHGGLGIGFVDAEGADQTGSWPTQDTRGGLALGCGSGFRLVSPARELGLSLGLRTSHVFARGARSHFLALTFGAAINPR